MQKDLLTFPITINLRLIALSALILAGCQLANSTPSAPPISVTATVAPSRIPPVTATTAPSHTPPPSPLPSPSLTATLQSSTCPRRVENSAVTARPTGYLILSVGDEKSISRLYRLNLQSGARDPFLPDLPPGFVEATITSPDGRWLAFIWTEESVDRRREIGKRLVVASADATEVHVIPLVEQLQYIQLADWTSDGQRIVAYPFGPLVMVESSLPFYGLSPDGRYIWFEVLDGPSGPGDYIWDRKSSTLIDCFKGDSILFPVWSPDGRYFIHHPRSGWGPDLLLAIDLRANIYIELGPADEFPDAWLSADK